MRRQTVLYAVAGVPAALLAWALLPGHPYGYFLFLRVVVCFAAVYLAVTAHRVGSGNWTWLMAATAALYNPFVRVHLTRDIWWVVNVATIVLLIAVGASLAARGAGSTKGGQPFPGDRC